MSHTVPVANKLKAVVQKQCQPITDLDDNVIGERDCEHLVYLTVPAAGGDGLLLGVTDSEQAAEAIASSFNLLFGTAHTHV